MFRRLASVALAATLPLWGLTLMPLARANGFDTGLVRVVSPDPGSLVTGSAARLEIMVKPGARSVRVWLNDQPLSALLHQHGQALTGTASPASGLHGGLNYIVVRAVGADGRSGFASARFVFGSGSLSLIAAAARDANGVVRVTVQTFRRPTVFEATLNGRNIQDLFRRDNRTTRVAALGAADGLKFGRNLLQIVAYDNDGTFAAKSLSFDVPADRPLVGVSQAGRVERGQTVRLDGRSSRPSLSGHPLSYRWEVAQAPPGSHPRLTDADTAQPSFQPDRVGRYRLRLTVGESDAPPSATAANAADEVEVTSQFYQRPMGLQIETMAIDPGTQKAAVRLTDPTGAILDPFDSSSLCGNKSSKGYCDAPGAGIQVLVLDRGTLAVVSNQAYLAPSVGNIATNSAAVDSALSQLSSTIENLPSSDLVIVSISPTGTKNPDQFNILYSGPNTSVPSLSRTMIHIGGTSLVPGHQPVGYSIIGIPETSGAAHEGMQFSITPVGTQVPFEIGLADLSGFLQLDPYNQYVFTPGGYVAFRTATQVSPTSTSNIMTVGATNYTSATLPTAQSGFQVVILNGDSAQFLEQRTFATNTGSATQDGQNQQAMATFIQQNVAAGPVVILVQSIGTPYPTTPQWASIGNAVAALGGNQHVFNTLKGGYALVGSSAGPGWDTQLLGRAPAVGPAMEVSTALTGASGQLNGLLARSKQNEYVPQLADTTSTGFDYSLAPIAYQRPHPWPFQDQSWYQRAWPLIAQALSIYTKSTTGGSCAQVLDFRDNYWCDGTAVWSIIYSKLGNDDDIPYPGQTACSCSSAEWSALKKQLAREVGWVAAVQKLLGTPGGTTGELQQPFIANGLANYIALSDVINNIETYVKPSPRSNTANYALSIVSDLLYVASDVGGLVAAAPEPKSVATKSAAGPQGPGAGESSVPGVIGVFADVFALISDSLADDENGSPLLAQVQTAASGLPTELENNYQQSLSAFQQISDIVVSDYGKLQAVGTAATENGNWQWGSDTAQSINQYLALSAKQFAYKALLPIVYPVQLLSPAANQRYPNKVKSTVCEWWCWSDNMNNFYTPACVPTPSEWMFWVTGFSGGTGLPQAGVLFVMGTLDKNASTFPEFVPNGKKNPVNPVASAFTQGSGEYDGGLLLPYYIKSASQLPRTFSCPDD